MRKNVVENKLKMLDLEMKEKIEKDMNEKEKEKQQEIVFIDLTEEEFGKVITRKKLQQKTKLLFRR